MGFLLGAGSLLITLFLSAVPFLKWGPSTVHSPFLQGFSGQHFGEMTAERDEKDGKMREFCTKFEEIMGCHRSCGLDISCHKTCPMPECPKLREKFDVGLQCLEECKANGRDFECLHECAGPFMPIIDKCRAFNHDHHHRGDADDMMAQKIREMFRERWACVSKCNNDEACEDKCPKPWDVIAQKCAELKPIIDCHDKCGHDVGCHAQCPLPECEMMQKKIKAALECHGACGSDHSCHHECGHPVRDAQEKCAEFEKVHACHQACAHHDWECHHKCHEGEDHHHWGPHGDDGEDHHHWGHHHGDGHHHQHHGKGEWHHHGDGEWHHHGDGEEHHHHGEGHHHGMGWWHHHGEGDEHHHHGDGHHHGKDEGHHHEEREEHHHGNEEHHPQEDRGQQEGKPCHKGEGPPVGGEKHLHEQNEVPEDEVLDARRLVKEFTLRYEAAMQERSGCKVACGADESCIQNCPKPWLKAVERCSEVKTIVDCHRQCSHDGECHRKCPMPECHKMKQLMENSFACHEKCGPERECHGKCPKPLQFISEKCDEFNDVHSCHQKCNHGDHGCHVACPQVVLNV